MFTLDQIVKLKCSLQSLNSKCHWHLYFPAWPTPGFNPFSDSADAACGAFAADGQMGREGQNHWPTKILPEAMHSQPQHIKHEHAFDIK